MLDLMTDASQHMAGMRILSCCSFYVLRVLCHVVLLVLLVGSFLDAAAEEQRVNSRVEVLQLARKNNIDF
jgi:hypothetical protein